MSTPAVLKAYQAKATLLQQEITALKGIINRYSVLRLGIFVLAILTVYLLFDYGLGVVAITGIVMLVAFLILVKIQFKKQAIYQFKVVQLMLLQNEISIINGEKSVYNNGSQFADPQHPYSDDLDVFGENAVFAYINRCATLDGNKLLAKFLKDVASKIVIEERQEAIQELIAHEEETLDFRTRLFNLDIKQVGIITHFFNSLLSKELSFIKSPSVKLITLLTPILNIGLLIIAIIFNGVFWSILTLSLLFSGVAALFFKRRIDVIHQQISESAVVLESYSVNLKWMEETEWNSTLLNNITNTIKRKPSLNSEIKTLSKILIDLNYRLNPIAGIFLNLFFQWDLRCIKKLNDWEAKNQSQLINGFEALAQFEVFISLVVLDHNHPDWIYPEISESPHFKGESVGHFLIDEHKRVNNDFSLAPQVTVDVITGSNMAGKSTFLRTIGVNMILAYAGAKVCASVFETSIFKLISYMRIKDSLADQTSTFKAEIDRLKMILDFTLAHQDSFVLIDEMLRGTNSRDKYLGSKVFIKKLISQETPGFIATHDLQVAELEKHYPTQLRNFHFDIQLEKGEMFFDYKIKKGECKTFNASLLLKAIGLSLEE
ncbi:MAG: DNA mismatch repair protein MutS [Pelobium sp.]